MSEDKDSSEYSKKCVQQKINRTRSQVQELGHVYSSCLAVSVLSRLCFLRVNQKCLEQCEKQNVQGTIPRRQTAYSHLLFVGKLCRRRRLQFVLFTNLSASTAKRLGKDRDCLGNFNITTHPHIVEKACFLLYYLSSIS